MTMHSFAANGAAGRTADEAWARTWQPRPDARLRLICFPPAGAGAMFFRPWAQRLPAEIEVVSVLLPGRENRIAEPLITDYRQAVSALHTALRPLTAQPYALFGHSMGALLAYGFALETARYGGPAPVRLFVSGAAGPGTETRKNRTAWTDDEIVAELRTMGGTPEAVFAEPELLALMLPIFRADFAVCDAFRAAPPAADPVLECPVTILGGAADEYSAQQLASWADVTRGPSRQRMFPGGHFFLSEESAEAVPLSVGADLADATR